MPLTIHLNLDLRTDPSEPGAIVDVTIVTTTDTTYAIVVEVDLASRRTVERQAEAALAGFRLGLRIGTAARD